MGKRYFCMLIMPVLLGAAPAQARIGATEQKCVELYGPVVKVLKKGLLFVKDGVKIYVTFNNGVADGVFFQKPDRRGNLKPVPIGESEIKAFLADNSCGCQWRYSSVLPDGDQIWITQGSELGALYSQATCSLQVYTRENIAR
jgi:hypothetical protein